MYGVIDFYRAAKSMGLSLLLAVKSMLLHVPVLIKCMNWMANSIIWYCCVKITKDMKNLTALVSQAWTEGFYSKPRVDLDLLAKHSEGLISLPLPVLLGAIPRACRRGDYEEAKRLALGA